MCVTFSEDGNQGKRDGAGHFFPDAGPARTLKGAEDIYEQTVVKPVPSQGSGRALSLPKGRSRYSFAGIPDGRCVSPSEAGVQEA
jgi:hypothetical protein